MGGAQEKMTILRTFSLVRSNIADQSTSQHLGNIEEEGELYLIDDLGADHEDSTPEEDIDDEEILIVDSKRKIGRAHQQFGDPLLEEEDSDEEAVFIKNSGRRKSHRK